VNVSLNNLSRPLGFPFLKKATSILTQGARRYQLRPIIVTTNRPFAEWNDIFPNAACVVTLIDRLVHRCEILPIEASSYRLKEAQERADHRKAARPKRLKKTLDKQP
jgi:IstB-like ATP binding protein